MRNPIIALTLGVCVVAAGCTAAPTPSAPPVATDPPTTPAPSSAAPSTPGGATPGPEPSLDQAAEQRLAAARTAVATAAQAVSGTVTKIEWDDQHWEAEVIVGDLQHELDLSPDGSQVTRTDNDPDRLSADEVTRYGATKIDVLQAIDRGLQLHPGTLVEADLDTDRPPATGTHWEIKVTAGSAVTEFVLDGATGEKR